MGLFTEQFPSTDSYWCSIILFSNNVASYKFALAKSSLELASEERTNVSFRRVGYCFSPTHL